MNGILNPLIPCVKGHLDIKLLHCGHAVYGKMCLINSGLQVQGYVNARKS